MARSATQAQQAARAAPGNFQLAADTGRSGVVRTGPSGLVLGNGPKGPVTIRLFRERGTRLAVSVPQYVAWLLTFRSISLGAHISLLPTQEREWLGLVERVRRHGGTVDVVPGGAAARLPEAGLPYRPSLIVDDTDLYDGSQAGIGAWQAVLLTTDLREAQAVGTLRSVDMTLVNSADNRVIDNLRRAYFLSPRQVKACQLLAEDEVMLAMPRRVVKLSVRPTPLEYQLLFGAQ
ncbi:hypothetical protein [Enemella evansiae]|uniref:Uncharacterized protein n=1 Tax=Enemella evansiae TaxID=2016499 RepID=A0A255GBM3_9ACTN|nr:hypothetical protein [Enemella evansiae]PFG65575.1 hypothetical protein B0O41_0340 [Propionibacteriaceae bacterium ES.041]OYN96333.1 hypothetical protein CGZ96_13830 [Enemella evansiae]OYO01850.1 hypothetical protein CGZ97_15630 [Enemella evansiae]OYO06718.1 hypothetical protein CGZ95_00045 [Enemella evansiae]OYO12961.1 hypothetical protein CGZ94_13860 [Enemella evansiae]